VSPIWVLVTCSLMSRTCERLAAGPINQSETMMAKRAGWMIYGANGYAGQLVAVEATRRGLNPVLAGRRAGPVVATLSA
jgi:hypothetical protein